MRLDPVASKRCSGPPAGTWKARPAGMASRRRPSSERELAGDHEAPVRLRARRVERRPGRAARGDLGQHIGHLAEHREPDGDATLPDGSQVGGGDMHSGLPRVGDAVVGVWGPRVYRRFAITAQPSCDAGARSRCARAATLQRSPWCRVAVRCACPSTADRARDLSSRGRASLLPEPHLAEPAMNPPPIRTGRVRRGRCGIAAGAPPDRHLAEAILDSIVEAILVFDLGTRLVSEVNHGATRLLGVDRGRPHRAPYCRIDSRRWRRRGCWPSSTSSQPAGAT